MVGFKVGDFPFLALRCTMLKLEMDTSRTLLTDTPLVVVEELEPEKQERKERKPRARKQGLREGQVRILQVLSRVSGPLNKNELSKRADITTGWAFNHLGSVEPEQWEATEKRTGYPGLIKLGYVEFQRYNIDGKWEYSFSITQLGRDKLVELEELERREQSDTKG